MSTFSDPVDFPIPAETGELYSQNDRTWMWDGQSWNSLVFLPIPPDPTYAISTDTVSVNEGATVNFTVTTTDVGSVTLYWTVSGTTDSADFTSSISGSVSIVNDTGSISVAILEDLLTEGAESFYIDLRTDSVSGTVVATSNTVTIADTSITPVGPPPLPDFANGNFETGDFSNWTLYDEQVSPGGVVPGVRGTILECPIPADPTPYPTNGSQTSPGQSSSFSSGGFVSAIVTPGYAASYSAKLTINGGTVETGGQTVYGPALVSNNPVIAAEGDRLSFWWTAEGGGDAYNVFAYAIDPNNACKTLILLDDTGNSGSATTPWTQVTRVIGPGEAGNYHFVFICGTFDFSFGTAVGATLSVDEIQLQKAGTY